MNIDRFVGRGGSPGMAFQLTEAVGIVRSLSCNYFLVRNVTLTNVAIYWILSAVYLSFISLR